MAITNNPGVVVSDQTPVSASRAQRLAERYRCPFIDLSEQRIDPELFRSIPAELMFRYNFVRWNRANEPRCCHGRPQPVQLTDELRCCSARGCRSKLPPPTQICDLLKRTEQSQRVLDQATEGFTLQVVGDEEDTDENISMEKLTRTPA